MSNPYNEAAAPILELERKNAETRELSSEKSQTPSRV